MHQGAPADDLDRVGDVETHVVLGGGIENQTLHITRVKDPVDAAKTLLGAQRFLGGCLFLRPGFIGRDG